MAALINKDTAVWRGIRTGLQAAIGLFVGAVLAVWNVPGVPDALYTYVANNVVGALLSVGIPAGIAGFVWNAMRRDVQTA